MAGDPDQETVPVYPVPAVVVVTGVAPVTGAVTPAIGSTEMGIKSLTVNVNVCAVDPAALVAVIV